MLKVLKAFTTVNSRFSPEKTPEITHDDVSGHVLSVENLIARGFLAAPGAAETADAPLEAAPKPKKLAS